MTVLELAQKYNTGCAGFVHENREVPIDGGFIRMAAIEDKGSGVAYVEDVALDASEKDVIAAADRIRESARLHREFIHGE